MYHSLKFTLPSLMKITLVTIFVIISRILCETLHTFKTIKYKLIFYVVYLNNDYFFARHLNLKDLL